VRGVILSAVEESICFDKNFFATFLEKVAEKSPAGKKL